MDFWGRYSSQYSTLPEKVPGKLKLFIRSARIGNFVEADRIFSQSLTQHQHLGPVFFERADALANQGRYCSLRDFLKSAASNITFETGQFELLALLKALSEIYVRGVLLSPLNTARQFRRSRDLLDDWDQCSVYQVS